MKNITLLAYNLTRSHVFIAHFPSFYLFCAVLINGMQEQWYILVCVKELWNDIALKENSNEQRIIQSRWE